MLRCPECSRETYPRGAAPRDAGYAVSLNKDGTIRHHLKYPIDKRIKPGQCPGTGELPVDPGA